MLMTPGTVEEMSKPSRSTAVKIVEVETMASFNHLEILEREGKEKKI